MNIAGGSSSSCSSSLRSKADYGGDQRPHILAVDDNLIDRKLIEKLLVNSSCRVTTAENGLRALEFLGLRDDQPGSSANMGTKVNMIITDYCMPGMTGYELLKKIKVAMADSCFHYRAHATWIIKVPFFLLQGSSILKEVPVVIMSSENIPTRINKCLEEGAQMFILKPLKQSDVKKLRCLIY